MHGKDALGLAGGVFGRARDLHCREGDAARALAGDLVVAEHGPAAVALREHAEVVPLVDFEHVGLEQGVVHAAREAHAVVGERVAIEFRVLADLAAVIALEPGLERLQGSIHGELRRRAGIVMPSGR